MVNKIVRTFTPQTFFFCEETDIKLAPGDGKQIDEGGTVGDRDSLWGHLAWAKASEDGRWASVSWQRA